MQLTTKKTNIVNSQTENGKFSIVRSSGILLVRECEAVFIFLVVKNACLFYLPDTSTETVGNMSYIPSTEWNMPFFIQISSVRLPGASVVSRA